MEFVQDLSIAFLKNLSIYSSFLRNLYSFLTGPAEMPDLKLTPFTKK